MRKLWLALGGLVLLAVGIWLGATAAWKLREAALRHGCVPFLADVGHVKLHPADPQRLRFAVLGDTGTGSAGERRVADALRRVCDSQGCDFVALLGDNLYPNGATSMDDPRFKTAFESVYGWLKVPVLLTLGNHDVHNQAIYEVMHTRESRLWTMPNFEYHYKAGAARFFAINTNCQPVTWWRLAPEVAQHFNGWTFVLGHHSIYAKGPHGDLDWIDRWFWGKAQPHVDFYVSGFNHLMEHLQRPGERTDYVVSGAAGDQPPNPKDFKGPTAAKLRFWRNEPGFAWFQVTPQQVTLRFYDENAKLLYQYDRTRIAH